MGFTDRIQRDDFEKMPQEYRDLLVRVLTIQSDCEIGGPNVYARRWMLNAPTADDMHRVARIVAEEVDHFRKFAGVLRDVGVDVSYLLHRDNSERLVDAFHEKDPPTWGDVAAFCGLIDRVGRYQGEEFHNSSYLPIDKILPSIMQEEVGHIAFGVQKLQELVKTEEGAAEAQAAVDRWVPIGLDMFGRANSRRAERYIYWGLKRRTNEQARQEYLAEITTVINNLGLRVPDTAEHRVHV